MKIENKEELWKQFLEKNPSNEDLSDIIESVYTYDLDLLEKASKQLLSQSPSNRDLTHILDCSQIFQNSEITEDVCIRLLERNPDNDDLVHIIRYTDDQRRVEEACERLIERCPNDYEISVIIMNSRYGATIERAKRLPKNNKCEIMKSEIMKKLIEFDR